ncbi:MAG: single-stranded-DNA-specific exonuclease RecJ [Candidatus Omnitrophica bacterium]|nr:single-stranded-DNA-specific exonuclease RecJ [Candidatus Omnitrophota bacterium]
MRKIWKAKEKDPSAQKRLSETLLISPIVAQLLINRNIETPEKAEDFLRPSLLNLHDALLMKDMARAAARIKKAIHKKERIMIYGDYDVDGISATALLSLIFKGMGSDVKHYIPNRLEEGYGLNKKAIVKIHKSKIDLLITVDCGITACDEVKELNRLGIETIITDHHNPRQDLPEAYAIINPLQKGCDYPDKSLSGVGVAFKLASALLGRDNNSLYEHLDLVCLGTVADVVPLIGENRILVKSGLDQLTHTKKKGLKALIEKAYLKSKDITSHYVGFMLGPRINAMGRLGSPELSLQLLLTDNDDEARELARTLDRENRNRQKMEEAVLKQALAKVEREMDFKENLVIVLEDEEWHHGVIGIVASRLVDRFYRPTIMMSTTGNETKGSARSIKNFHLFEALSECSNLLKTYGGHKYAAGLSMSRNRLLDFKKRINTLARERILPTDLIPVVNIDVEMPLSSLSKKLLLELDELSPFGLGNPKPVFSSCGLSIRSLPKLLRRDGIKMWVTDGKKTAEAIGFKMADALPSDPLGQKVDIAYACNLNTYKGITSIQLQLKDLRLSESGSPQAVAGLPTGRQVGTPS